MTLEHSFSVVLEVVAEPDFSISGAPPKVKTFPGKTAAYTVTVVPLNGFAGAVNLRVEGLPVGALYVFAPVQLQDGGGTSTLTVTLLPDAPLGLSRLDVFGREAE